jgi:two-component system, sensor histidine kinase and response regulator
VRSKGGARFRQAWTATGGIVITLATVAALELLSRFLVPVVTPAVVLLFATAYATYLSGVRAGLVSLAITLGYVAWIFSSPGQPFAYTYENAIRVVILAVVAPVAVLIVGLLKDRSARLRSLRVSEARLRGVLDAATEYGIVGTDPTGLINIFNQGAERMLGYSPAEVVGKYTPLLFHDPAEIAARAAALGVAPGLNVFFGPTRHGQAETREWTFLRRDGSRLPVALTVGVVRDAAGAVTGFVGIAADLTARKQADAEREHLLTLEQGARQRLEESNRALTEATRAKSEFLANMSHEIRTPMNGVIGLTGLLLDTDLDAEQREYAEAVRRSGEALLTIVNDILDFSKIEAGKVELELLDFDLREAVDDVVGLLAEQAGRKAITLAASMAGDVPWRVRGDVGRLRQVLTNLVGNAVKFTEVGEVVVAVTCAAAAADPDPLPPDPASAVVDLPLPGAVPDAPPPSAAAVSDLPPPNPAASLPAGSAVALRFEVRDTGIGIEPAARERLFQPFSQADTSTTRRYGGTGLGLVICQRLVELMGGQIGVDSVPGRGSLFWFTVRFGAAAPLAPATHPALQGLRALIVDNQATRRAFLGEALASWGVVADAVSDGAAALAALRTAATRGTPYALALIQRGPPETDGLALVRAIGADPALAEVRLILLVQRGRDRRGELAATPGIAAVLREPIRQSQLLETLLQVCGVAVPNPAVGAGRAVGGPGESAVTAADRAADASAASPAAVAAGRILVAEDSAMNQQVALAMLRKLGYRADTVGDGREAVEALSQIPYAAVLMDCQMPVMDGFEATRAIRSREGAGRHTPVIAMTANAMEGDRERCLAAGMDDYLAKPVRAAELAAALARWVGPAAPRAVGDGGAPATP